MKQTCALGHRLAGQSGLPRANRSVLSEAIRDWSCQSVSERSSGVRGRQQELWGARKAGLLGVQGIKASQGIVEKPRWVPINPEGFRYYGRLFDWQQVSNSLTQQKEYFLLCYPSWETDWPVFIFKTGQSDLGFFFLLSQLNPFHNQRLFPLKWRSFAQHTPIEVLILIKTVFQVSV